MRGSINRIKRVTLFIGSKGWYILVGSRVDINDIKDQR